MFFNDNFINYLITNFSNLSYLFIFLIVLIESIPLFCLLIPGIVFMILVGIFVKIGDLNLFITIIFAFLGVFIGDLISYFLGRKFGYKFIRRFGRYFFLKENNFKKTKKLFKNHIGKTLILGRFNSLTRGFTPFVAGSSEVSFFSFLIYNFLGGFLWVLTFIMMGYIFGENYEYVLKNFERFILVLIIFIVFFIFIKYKRKFKHSV